MLAPSMPALAESPVPFTSQERWHQPAVYDTVVIYHGGCPDGAAAAAAFLARFGFSEDDKIRTELIYFHAAFERDIARDTKMPSLGGKTVYIVDYSYSAAVMRDICRQARAVFLWDHHKTAVDAMTEIRASPSSNLSIVFDMDRCGAEIAWTELGLAHPWWMKHVRDRDLWEWKHANSMSFSAAIYATNITPSAYVDIIGHNEKQRQDLYLYGAGAHQVNLKTVGLICRSAIWVRLDGLVGKLVCAPVLGSEVGNELLKDSRLEFSAMYRHDIIRNEWLISLRGRKGERDLTKIAEKRGGGGHAEACGFTHAGDILDLFDIIGEPGR